jgi:DNA-directed RNA polymerase subunit RPC12/RpoP/predicted RNA-binding Zn-ribbon protein involved in translation (DUF1610 family)
MFQLTCKCGAVYSVEDDVAGQSIQCSSCHRSILIPQNPLLVQHNHLVRAVNQEARQRRWVQEKAWICTSCGWIGEPGKVTPGSFGVELACWLCFCLPGLIYSIWRLTSKHHVCDSCGQPTIIPVSSPTGQRLLQERESRSKGP